MSYSSQDNSRKVDNFTSNPVNNGSFSPIRLRHDLKILSDGRYRIVKQVGHGGMAVVFHAYDTENDRDVAIKVLSLDLAGEEAFLERFRRESEMMRDLSHPNILRAYDYGQDGEIVFLVMSFFGGGTLKERINGPLPLRTIADYLRQISAGLGYAHSRNIVHRDVKPSNVLVHHASEKLVLSDFGIAKALSGSTAQTGTIMGTPLYMAPEQFLDKVDQRTDIYALGIVLYQMLTGEVPFKGEGIGFKHLNDPVPPLSAFGLDYDPAIEQVVLKALAKNPDERFQHAEELADAFDRAINTFAQNPTGILAVEKPNRTNKADEALILRWSDQLKSPALPGQDSLSALPVIQSNSQLGAAYAPLPDNFHNFGSLLSSSPIPTTNQNAHENYRPITNANANVPLAQVPVWSQQTINVQQYPPEVPVIAPLPTFSDNFGSNMARPAPTSTYYQQQPLQQEVATPTKINWLMALIVFALVLGIVAISIGIFFYVFSTSAVTVAPTSTAQAIRATTTPSKTAQTTTTPNVTATTGSNGVPTTANASNVVVVYVASINSNTEVVYSYNGKTNIRNQLTNAQSGVSDTNPIWANNGQSVLFQSDRDNATAGLWLMSNTGTNQTELIDHAYSPAISHKNDLVAYTDITSTEIFLVSFSDLNKHQRGQQLTHDGRKKFGVVFSPDDTKIAYSELDSNSIYQLFVLDIKDPNAKPQQITNSSQHCVYPTWSPDGTKIAYNSAVVDVKNPDNRQPLDIYVIDADGKNNTQLTKNSGGNSRAYWIDDKQGPGNQGRIYFNSNRSDDDNARIYVMLPDGTKQQVLFNDFISDSNGKQVEDEVDDFAPCILLSGH